MAAARAKTKVKKKKWVAIVAPKLFNNKVLGETQVEDAKQALGKTIMVSMMHLTKEPKKQATSVTFTIDKQLENGVGTSFKRIQIMPNAIKRMARRNKNRVDDSFLVQTKDEQQMRIKPLIITRGTTSNLTKTAIRKIAKAYIFTEAKKKTVEELFKEVVEFTIQKKLFETARKIHPLTNCEIRCIELQRANA